MKYWNTYNVGYEKADMMTSYLEGYSIGTINICNRPYWIRKNRAASVDVLLHADDECHCHVVEEFFEK